MPWNLYPPLAACCWVLLVSCSSGRDGGAQQGPERGFMELEGQVLDTSGKPAAGVPVTALGSGATALTGIDGFFSLALPEADPRLEVGSPGHGAYTVRVALDGGAGVDVLGARLRAGFRKAEKHGGPHELGRALFIDLADSGFGATVREGRQQGSVMIESAAFPGLSLTIPAGAEVGFPPGAEEEVFLLGMAGDRLPLPLPAGRFAPFAVLAGPSGTRFEPPARLVLPNAAGLAPGSRLDLFELSPATGLWTFHSEVEVDGAGFEVTGAEISRGGLLAALPRTRAPLTSLRGRILGRGGEPIEDYRVLTICGHAAASDDEGFFSIPDLPVLPGLELRVAAVSPRSFRPEFVVSPARAVVLDGVTDFGNLPVASALRTAIPPALSYDPPDGRTGVSELARVKVTFAGRMDLDSVGIQLVRGISRQQKGVAGSLAFRFAGESTVLEFLPFVPLQNGVFYTIFVPRESRDLQGNFVDPAVSFSRFTVRAVPAPLQPGELRLQSSTPFLGRAGDTIEIFGENLDVDVRFGGVPALVRSFDDLRRDRIAVRVPAAITAEVAISIGGSGPSLPFRAVPSIDFLDMAAAPPSGGVVRVAGCGVHLGSSPRVIAGGVPGGGFTLLPAAPERPNLQCFSVELPAGVGAGTLILEVDGFRTRGFFVAQLLEADAVPPAVVETSAGEGDVIDPELPVVLRFSEVLDQESRAELLDGAEPVAGVVQTLANVNGASEIRLAPPAGGFPRGRELTLRAGPGIRDLAGNALDQDLATAEIEAFEVTFRVED
jgi:hypothetical protein